RRFGELPSLRARPGPLVVACPPPSGNVTNHKTGGMGNGMRLITEKSIRHNVGYLNGFLVLPVRGASIAAKQSRGPAYEKGSRRRSARNPRFLWRSRGRRGTAARAESRRAERNAC